MTFQEFDFDGARTDPRCPLVELAVDRLRETFTRAGADIRMGMKLGRAFEDAGFPPPAMLLGARVERGPDAMTYEQIVAITRSLLPLMERTQVAISVPGNSPPSLASAVARESAASSSAIRRVHQAGDSSERAAHDLPDTVGRCGRAAHRLLRNAISAFFSSGDSVSPTS